MRLIFWTNSNARYRPVAVVLAVLAIAGAVYVLLRPNILD
jgi:hypothetical protein